MENSRAPLVIGIAGASGSGKTTLASAILDAIGHHKISFLPHDAYYRDQAELSFEERLKINYDHPDSLESDLLIKHILALKSGKAVKRPVYDYNSTRALRKLWRLSPARLLWWKVS